MRRRVDADDHDAGRAAQALGRRRVRRCGPVRRRVPAADRAEAATTIPLTQFGGYGLAVASHGAHAKVARAACGSPATAHLAAAGARPIVSCVTVAQVMQQLSDAVVASNFDPGVIDAAGQAGLHAVDNEISQVAGQAPSEAGLAEIEAVLPYAIGIERQRELMGLPKDALSDKVFNDALEYQYRFYSDQCGKTQPRSDVYYAYGLRLIGLSRQQQLLGFALPGDLATLFDKCVSKIHLQLDSLIDATVHTSGGRPAGARSSAT